MMGQGIFQVMAQGGITMVVLAIFSIFSLAVIGERLYTFYKAQQATGQVAEKGLQYVADGKMVEALRLCQQNDGSPIAKVLTAGLLAVIDRDDPAIAGKQFARRLESCKGAMQRATSAEISRLERYLGSLATLGNVSPFVGLFGTVLGIIRASRRSPRRDPAGSARYRPGSPRRSWLRPQACSWRFRRSSHTTISLAG